MCVLVERPFLSTSQLGRHRAADLAERSLPNTSHWVASCSRPARKARSAASSPSDRANDAGQGGQRDHFGHPIGVRSGRLGRVDVNRAIPLDIPMQHLEGVLGEPCGRILTVSGRASCSAALQTAQSAKGGSAANASARIGLAIASSPSSTSTSVAAEPSAMGSTQRVDPARRAGKRCMRANPGSQEEEPIFGSAGSTGASSLVQLATAAWELFPALARQLRKNPLFVFITKARKDQTTKETVRNVKPRPFSSFRPFALS